MNARQWARVKDIFHAALDRGQDERADFVAHACADDAALKLEVERLLAAHHEAGLFLAEPAGTLAAGSMTGQVIGRYEIGRTIGGGGMGEVYVARDVELKRDVAIKFALVHDDGVRLRREAQHASRLNHPHICTIHEVGSNDGRTFIVMEHVTGDRLRDVIPPQGLPVDNVLHYGAQIADALAHAHDNGVTHRDLKPANVMVSKAGRTKVLDFGIARVTAQPDATETTERPVTMTAPGVVMGTVAYMAPELLRGEPANAASDIWALGVILYEMVNGAQPFSGATGFEVTGAILHAQPPPLRAGIPVSLEQIIMRCLAKDPASRYATAHEVRAALDAAATVSTSRPPLSWSRAALAAGVITAVVASVIVWRSSRAPDTIGLGAAGRPAIAVMAFDNLAGGQDTAWLSQGIPSMLVTGLAQTRGLDIVSAQRLREAVRQFGGAGLETLPRDQFAQIAQRAGAGAIVVGGISRAGPEIRIDAHLEDLTTGRVLAAQSVRGSDLFLLVDQLAARIRDDIGLQATDEIRRVSEISTGSIEAFQLYSQGVDAFINYHWEEARTLLERAVGIDPGFADAYLHLSFANFFLGNHALQAQNLRKASEHASRLSARRRLVLDVELARDGGDGPAAARTLDELIRRFPDDEDAYNLAALLYDPLTGLIDDSQKYLIIAARGAAAVPKSTLLRNLYAYTLLYVGRHEEAVTEFENNVRLASREPNSYDSLGEAYLVTGRPANAIESYGQALAIDPGFSGSHQGRAWAFAMLGQFESAVREQAPPGVQAFILSRVGRFREAGQLLEQARRDAVKAGNNEEQGQLDLVSAMLAIERSDYRRAVQECDAAERVLAGLPKSRQRMRLALLHVLKGTALVRTGTIGDARTQLATVAVLHKPGVEAEHFWFKALEGEIALAAGDVAGAAAAFTAGQPARKMSFETLYMSLSIVTNNLTSRDGLARVARMQGDSARAIEIYRQLLSTGPEQKFVSAFDPHYVLEIARLLDRAGDGPGASKEYNRFLELWARADVDAPELGEARRAIKRLSAVVPIPSPRATASVDR